MAIYIKYIQWGMTYNNKQVLCSATVQGYAKAVNNLFKLRSFSPPADLFDPNNMMAILLNNMLREEDIARQRAPLDNKIYAKLCQTAIASKCKDSVSDLLFDVGNLPEGYIHNVPLPQVPQGQSTFQSRVPHLHTISHYYEDTYGMPTYKDTWERIATANSP